MSRFLTSFQSQTLDGKSILLASNYLLIASACLIPSLESHGLLNIKTLAFLFSFFAFCFSLVFDPSLSTGSKGVMRWFFVSLAFTLFWFVVGARFALVAVDQVKLVFITFWAMFLSLYLVKQKVMAKERVLQAAIFSSFLYAFCKIVLAGLILWNAAAVIPILEKLGIRLVTFSIFKGVQRLQTSCDLFAPYLLFFVLLERRFSLSISPRFRFLFIIVSWVSILLSFSRYLMAVGLLSHLLYGVSGSFLRAAKTATAMFLAALTLVSIVGPERISTYLEKRFASEASLRSDEVREIQTEALIEEFEKTPYLGRGMGGHSEKVVRDPFRRHSYEVQWVAFLMQFGLLGISLILGAIFLFSVELLRPPIDREQFSLFLLFAVWLFSGFTNPFLISLGSGVMYSIFITASLLLKKKEKR